MKKIPFTKKGVEALHEELEKIKNERPAVISELKRAREMGDLSENGFYKATKGKLFDTDRRIRHLAFLITNSQIENSTQVGVVRIGNKVTFESEGKEYVYQIVGTYESNPSEGKISIESPLGKKLLGKKVGDLGEYIHGRSKTSFKVVKIS